MEWLEHAWRFVASPAIITSLTVFLFGVLIERAAPAQHGQPAAHLGFNVSYAVVATWLIQAVSPLTAVIAVAIVNACGGGFLALPSSGFWLLPGAALLVFAIDFMEYVFHRAQHAWPVLWAMHSFHHSDESVNVTTSSRNFWLEPIIKAIFVYPVVGILFKAGPTVMSIYALTTIWHYVNHLNLDIPCGRLCTIINLPPYHRLHHSRQPQHHNRNFAAYFPIFDILFGTHCVPVKGELPPTGLDTGEAPSGLAEAIFWPIRRHLRSLFA